MPTFRRKVVHSVSSLCIVEEFFQRRTPEQRNPRPHTFLITMAGRRISSICAHLSWNAQISVTAIITLNFYHHRL